MNRSLRNRLLVIIFTAVLAPALVFSRAIGDYLLAPLLNGLWRFGLWLYNLPYFIWWLILLAAFFYLGFIAFFHARDKDKEKIRPSERFKMAAWVRHWLSPIRQSGGGPFIRDAMMSYRRLAVQVLAQRENFTTREYTRLLIDGERSLPEEVSSLLEILEKLDEQRSLRRTSSFQRTLLRLRARFEGNPDLFPPQERSGFGSDAENLPALHISVRDRIERFILFLEQEVEINHDHAPH
jgi:hypothetical protein